MDDHTIGIALDPVLRQDGTLLYCEALCRPLGYGLDCSVTHWVQCLHETGQISMLDLCMARKAVAASVETGLRIAINVTPETIIAHGDELMNTIGLFHKQIVVEVVEWGHPTDYCASGFKSFTTRLRAAGFALFLDDVGTGAFTDAALVKSIPADGMKSHYDHLGFAQSLVTRGQDLVAEFVTNSAEFEQAIKSGATAAQGYYSRDAHARTKAGMVEKNGVEWVRAPLKLAAA